MNYQERVIMDKAVYRTDGRLWCHLAAKDLDILHSFAKDIGLQVRWFQDKRGKPHYDIKSAVIRNRARRLGAVEVSGKYLIEYLKHYYEKSHNLNS